MEEVNLRDVYQRLQNKRKDKKKIKKYIQEQMEGHTEFQYVRQQMEVLKEKKKQVEMAIREANRGEYEKVEKLDKDIKSDKEMVTDIAVNKLLNKEIVELTDEYNNKFVPHFAVTFKKVS